MTHHRPVVKVVNGGRSKLRPDECRSTIVGPGINQPDPYPGYGGFVGWVSPIRLRNGDLLVGFARLLACVAADAAAYSPDTIARYQKIGMPADVRRASASRAMIMHSTDEGKTWSKPVTMLDTPDDDRHPAFVELPDGTLLCSLFTYSGARAKPDYAKEPESGFPHGHPSVVRPRQDMGSTTSSNSPSPFLADETDGPLVLLKDGSILLTIGGSPKEGGPSAAPQS